MPDGILVLSTHVIESAATWLVVSVPIMLVLGIALFAVACSEDSIPTLVCSVVCGLCMAVGLVLLACGVTDHYDHTEYQVTIDDSVKVNELLDRYEIVSQDGLIYTIKERSETDEK